MKKLVGSFCLLASIAAASLQIYTQADPGGYKSQEISEGDGVPVLIKNLPDEESVRGQAKITNRIEEVRAEFGDPAVLRDIDLAGGAEAAYANYPEGRLLLIEYPTPQGATAASSAVLARLPESPGVVYRRIGNYIGFVFGAADPEAANALLGEITYGKKVQWLGEDPYFMQRFERYIAMTGRDMVISTVLFIVGVFGTAALIGIIAGFIYFRFRQQEQAKWHAFSDAGGLTRINLDELTD